MKIFNTRIYGLKESIIASGYPMQTEVIDWDTLSEEEFEELYQKGFNRARSLGNCKPNSGHDCYLKGVIVQADFQAPQHYWQQWQRYHFQDIVSSQSKMHCLSKFNLTNQCNKYVSSRIIKIVEGFIIQYNNDPTYENFRQMLDNVPAGFLLTARITTNYLQLKTEYKQRYFHKNEEWNTIFADWVEGLPLFEELCLSA